MLMLTTSHFAVKKYLPEMLGTSFMSDRQDSFFSFAIKTVDMQPQFLHTPVVNPKGRITNRADPAGLSHARIFWLSRNCRELC